MSLKFFNNLHTLEIKLSKLEQKLRDTAEQHQHELNLLKRQIVLSKQGAPILDWAIISSYPYIDLSPQQAYEQYMNPNVIYQVLDVTSEDYQSAIEFDNYIKIPFNQLKEKIDEVQFSKGILLVISEDGLNSIRACEMLAKLGVYNCFNVSGGYEYWPENRQTKKSA